MNFLTNYATMTADELNREMVSFVLNYGVEFNEYMPMTRENINWMVAVYAVEQSLVESAEDLTNLLAAMNKHYDGPISVHEGWGGCEADSNQELITEKIRFDMRENSICLNIPAITAAIELGWVEQSELDEDLDDMAYDITVGSTEEDGDCLKLDYSETAGAVAIHAYGQGDKRHLYVERAEIEMTRADFDKLQLRLHNIGYGQGQCAYVRMWVKQIGKEFVPN